MTREIVCSCGDMSNLAGLINGGSKVEDKRVVVECKEGNAMGTADQQEQRAAELIAHLHHHRLTLARYRTFLPDTNDAQRWLEIEKEMAPVLVAQHQIAIRVLEPVSL